MASEFVAELRPRDLQRETSLGNEAGLNLVATGDARAVPLLKYRTAANLAAYGYTACFRIPASLTMGTGLTLKIYLTDDGTSAIDLGKKVYVGAIVKRLSADETTDIDVAAGPEQLVSVTLSATAGGVAVGSLAIASANLDSAVVGDLVMIRVRRKGTDATNDTAGPRALLIGISVQNT